jgi:hypothetical protein
MLKTLGGYIKLAVDRKRGILTMRSKSKAFSLLFPSTTLKILGDSFFWTPERCKDESQIVVSI